MLYRITHLKAPWPVGAAVGAIIDLAAPLPGWATGKCVPAPDAEAATVAFAEPEPVRDLAAELAAAEAKLASAEAVAAEASAAIERLMAEADEREKALTALRADAAVDRKAAEDAITAAEQLRAKLAEAEAALAAATKPATKPAKG